MPKLVATIIMVLGLVACSTNYKLKDTSDPNFLEAYTSFECSSESNAAHGKELDLCESFGLKKEIKVSCAAKDQKCIRVHVRETVNFLDVSPAMIFFLGLIPSTQYYFYEVEITQTDQNGSEQRSLEKFEIIESWGTLNTIKRLVVGLNTKENEQSKIGGIIRGKYGIRI